MRTVRTEARLAIDGGLPVRATMLEAAKGISVFGAEERAAALEVLESRSLFRYYGPALLDRVAGFEAAACAFLGSAHAVATSSGTAALRAALAALGVGCGDEVILPAFTFIASVNAVVVAGAVPIFAEVDDTLGINPDDVAAKITDRTAAVMAVHLDNGACDMDPLLSVTAARGIPVLEDTAQAMGATYNGRALGTLGAIGAFSLQLEKNITTGEGGLVVTDDEDLYLRAARYQDQGGQFVTSKGSARGDAAEPFVGENLRMTELAGAIAGVQLAKLPALLERQRANQQRILAAVADVPGISFRRLPDPAGDGGSSVNLFLPDRESAKRFIKAMLAEGIPTGQFYGGKPVYLTPSIMAKRTASGKGGPWNCAEHPTDVEYGPGLCPATEELVGRSAIVLVGASYTEADCDDVAGAIAKVAAGIGLQ
jgi:8-amino-3,8-dideoxy-alpha-D-manno-octulosonate transaminase